MQLQSEVIKELNGNLQSNDASIRRRAVEKYAQEEVEDGIIIKFIEMLYDEDIGVRDSISKLLIKNKRKSVAESLVPLISSEQISIRNLAGEILVQFGEHAVDPLSNYLTIANDDDQKFVVDLLSLIGSNNASTEIYKVLKTSKNSNVIIACIEALGSTRYAEAVQPISVLYNNNDLYKPTIVEALGRIGTKEAYDFLLQNYNVEDDLTKFAIIESFGALGDEEAFFILISDLKKFSGPLCWAAVESLSQLKERLALDIPFDDNVKNALLSVLRESELKYQKAAISLLAVYDDKDLILEVLSFYGMDELIDKQIKEQVFANPVNFIFALLKYDFEYNQNIKSVLELTKEVIGSFGAEILDKLGDINSKNLCEIFSGKLSHADEEIRRYCTELLFFCAPDLAILYIDEMISDDNIWNRLRLVEILEYFINNETVKEAIEKLCDDSEEMVSNKANEVILANR
ncbi:MAG: hypothetical protein K9J16_02390 [Melioribacteraceae bacterium]|nr:hypothetical protein [Melioribacteraceae bacterium]MCF8353747.1 hypothetical protein [Melioribacteraceae bacterium]MCF8392444.1 hypothetical protein [Melioribacteraceae bacterium]MCF8418355.1 hypothetical protein [Melioribacteraceae bacterium]